MTDNNQEEKLRQCGDEKKIAADWNFILSRASWECRFLYLRYLSRAAGARWVNIFIFATRNFSSTSFFSPSRLTTHSFSCLWAEHTRIASCSQRFFFIILYFRLAIWLLCRETQTHDCRWWFKWEINQLIYKTLYDNRETVEFYKKSFEKFVLKTKKYSKFKITCNKIQRVFTPF